MSSDFVDIRFTVEAAHGGMRLDRYLCLKLRGLSRTRVQRIIEAQLVAERQLKAGSVVTAGLSFVLRRRVALEPATPTELPVLYEDEDLLVIDKPAGLPVHPSARYQHGTVVGRLRQRFGDGYAAPAHRLDRETSGVLVCSRTPRAAQRLMRAFRQGQVAKEYLAICVGWPPDDTFTVDAPLALGGDVVRIAVRVAEEGKPSRTRFVVERRVDGAHGRLASLRALPLTGRQHQIRAHLGHAGFPIVGDKIYADPHLYDRFTRHALTPADRARLILPRQALHAAALSMKHPSTAAELHFAAPLPEDLRTLLEPAAALKLNA